MSAELVALADWLDAEGVSHVAMESTGVYWKPVYNLLEGLFEVILVNAHRLRHVPGRKTDVKDAEWIAQLLQYGLLSPSFIPPPSIREHEFPSRVWAYINDTLHEARLHNELAGEYHGFPLEFAEQMPIDPSDILTNAPREQIDIH